LVDIADVPDGDEAMALDLTPALRHAVVGEVRKTADAHKHLPDFTGAELIAGYVEDLDDRALDRPANGSGLGQRLDGRVEYHSAGLGAAVVFVDDRPPPFDHLL